MNTTLHPSCAHPARRRASSRLIRRRENGSALIVGLVLLLVVTILAVAGMQDTLLQQRMSGNWNDRNLAFQASEAALRQGETWLETPGNPDTAEGHNRLNDPVAWEGGNPHRTLALGTAEPAATHIDPPSFPRVDGSMDAAKTLCDRVFSIYGHGLGGTENARVILQASVIPPSSVPVVNHPSCD